MSEQDDDEVMSSPIESTKHPVEPPTTSATAKLISVAAAAAAVVGFFVAWGVIDWQSTACTRFRIGASFAGSNARLNDYLNTTVHGDQCVISDLGSLRGGVLIAGLCGLLAGIILWRLLLWWWHRSWLTGPFRNASPVALLGLLAGVFSAALAVAIAASAQTSQGGDIALRGQMVRVMPALAWPALLFGALSVVLLMLTWLAYSNRRGIMPADDCRFDAPSGEPRGLGVSCSGGGIRAGAVALGVLGALEQYDVNGDELTMYDPPKRSDGSIDPEAIPISLDREQSILAKVGLISSVSGGGYTAGAYRVALGTHRKADGPDPWSWPLGLVGAPRWYTGEPPPAYDSLTTHTQPTIFRHLQARRQFLRTGRGGLPASVTVAVASLILQLAVLVATVVLVAWPMGRLASTWPVYGGIGCGATPTAPVCALINPAPPADASESEPAKPNYCDGGDGQLERSPSRTTCFVRTPGRQMPVGWQLFAPGVVLVALGALVFVIKMRLWHTTLRHRLSVVSGVLGGAGAFFLLVLVGVPLALDVLYPKLSSWQAIVPTLTALGGGTGVFSRYITPRLKKTASVLGTVLVMLAAGVVAIIVAGHAALRSGVFGFPGKGFMSYGAVVVLMAFAYLWLNPQTWSLSTLYRNRIRGAFGPTRDETKAPPALRNRRKIIDEHGEIDGDEPQGQRMYPYRRTEEPTVDKYVGASGPVHLVCCSAARRDRVATGISALSYVISSEGADLYEPSYGTAGRLDINQYHGSARQFVTALEARRKKDRVTYFGRRRRQAYGTETAAMSASAAAIASSMGRDNRRFPVAALSMLNVRLGMWLPNPRYLAAIGEDYFPFPQPRLAYLLKEIAGYWHRDDHHLYVTDGGHRENLGLVELLRRRCKTIICVDASGDTPGSFATLRQAADLARIETGAWLDLTPIKDLPSGRPSNAHFVLPVSYDEADSPPTATVIYIRAVVFSRLGRSLTAFAAEDPKFPNYSTGDQFLTDTQFNNLVQYGREAFLTALSQPRVLGAIRDAT